MSLLYMFGPGGYLIIIGIVISMWAQAKVTGTFNKYLRVKNRRGLTGYEVATEILRKNGVTDVQVVQIQGKLSDHFDPRRRVVRLSPDVYQGRSIASLAVAAHEIGHVLQHEEGYAPIRVRDSLVPVASIGSKFSWILILGGLFLGMTGLATIGVWLFSAVVLFQIVTLPVEFNASSRALATLEGSYYLSEDEMPAAKKVLNAAAMTYVAATLVAVLQLIRLLMLTGRRN
ncbi:zinc metallopeptidase [Gottschalkiaceae bacterium SANA]|nr:zinc metallopeptidase [Gottschalkiaceae bacterium SANA]